jgi:L-ascorbate metabolism protein UlaG (beta-lactamase superfamily)
MTEIHFLGHAAFSISDGGTTHVVVDPFLTGNPSAAISADDVNATTILITHAHADHVGDAVGISKRTGAPVVAIVELAQELGEEGIETIGINFGGTAVFDWGWAKMVPAWHTAVSAKGVGTIPAGYLINFKGTTIYHLGDTGLFSDLALVGRRHPIDVALVPIGGHFTMDQVDAVDAVDFVKPQVVIPCHYNTFPAIAVDVNQFQSDVESATSSHCVVLEPGQTHVV